MNWKKLLGLGGEDEDEIDVSSILEDLDKPRDHHYFFAHVLLRGVTFQLGATTLLILSHPQKSREFLLELWQDAAVQGEVPEDDRIAPEPLQAWVQPVREKLIAIVELPPVQRVAEAHFVAIVSDLPPQIDDDSTQGIEALQRKMRETPLRYFTLENGFTMESTPRTAFCEWTKDGSHLNMGDGPRPNREDLLEFLTQKFAS